MNPKGYDNPHLLITPADLAARLGVAEPRTTALFNARGAPLPRSAAPRGITEFGRGHTPARAAGADSLVAAAAGAEPRTRNPELVTRNQPPVLLDLRPAEEFAAGHIPSAVHLDLFGVSLIDTDPAPLEAFLWMIAHLLQSRGVTADRPVVVYDDQSGIRAARAFWFLEFFDHPDARLLDGGMGAWLREGWPVTCAASAPSKEDWQVGRVDARLASWRDVRDRLGRPGSVMLDTRSDGEYCGTTVRAARGGAIPGAVHIEWTQNLDATGAFKPAARLREMYERAGVTPDREVLSYCQGGYRAAHSYLALRLLGYPRVRNYIGSWKEWGDREDLPIEVPAKP